MYTPKGKLKKYQASDSLGEVTLSSTGAVYKGDVYYNSRTGKYLTANNQELELDLSETIESPAKIPYVEYDYLRKDGYSLRETTAPQPHLPTPTEEDYSAGVIARFLSYDKERGTVFEIDAKTYDALVKKSTKHYYPRYDVVSFLWRIKGPVANQDVNGYIVLGARDRNEKTISDLDDVIPNIRTYLTDPSQFVR